MRVVPPPARIAFGLSSRRAGICRRVSSACESMTYRVCDLKVCNGNSSTRLQHIWLSSKEIGRHGGNDRPKFLSVNLIRDVLTSGFIGPRCRDRVFKKNARSLPRNHRLPFQRHDQTVFAISRCFNQIWNDVIYRSFLNLPNVFAREIEDIHVCLTTATSNSDFMR